VTIALAMPVMQSVTDATGLTTRLVVPDGPYAVVTAGVDAPGSVRPRPAWPPSLARPGSRWTCRIPASTWASRPRARRAPPLITHRFPLDAYDQAYQVLRSGSGPRGHVMLEVGTP